MKLKAKPSKPSVLDTLEVKHAGLHVDNCASPVRKRRRYSDILKTSLEKLKEEDEVDDEIVEDLCKRSDFKQKDKSQMVECIVIDDDDDFSVKSQSGSKSKSKKKPSKKSISPSTPKLSLKEAFAKVGSQSSVSASDVSDAENPFSRTESKQQKRVRKSSDSKSLDNVSKAKWNCEACTFLNHLALKYCEMCETPKKTGEVNTKTASENYDIGSFHSDSDVENNVEVPFSNYESKTGYNSLKNKEPSHVDDEDNDNELLIENDASDDEMVSNLSESTHEPSVNVGLDRQENQNEHQGTCCVETSDCNTRKVDSDKSCEGESSRSQYFTSKGNTVNNIVPKRKEVLIENTVRLPVRKIPEITETNNEPMEKTPFSTPKSSTIATGDGNVTPVTSGKKYRFKSLNKSKCDSSPAPSGVSSPGTVEIVLNSDSSPRTSKHQSIASSTISYVSNKTCSEANGSLCSEDINRHDDMATSKTLSNNININSRICTEKRASSCRDDVSTHSDMSSDRTTTEPGGKAVVQESGQHDVSFSSPEVDAIIAAQDTDVPGMLNLR